MCLASCVEFASARVTEHVVHRRKPQTGTKFSAEKNSVGNEVEDNIKQSRHGCMKNEKLGRDHSAMAHCIARPTNSSEQTTFK